jgi:hypothetical protein
MNPTERRQSPQVFAAPRRYDLATMFTVSIAYALLFAGLRSLGADPPLVGLIGGFFTFVGIAQAILFGGNSPRKASCIAGAVYLAGFVVAESVAFAAGVSLFRLLGLLCYGIWGLVLGYVGGAIVGGVFLIADFLRRRIDRRR